MELSLDSTIELTPGVLMPRLGLGTYKSRDGEEVASAVREALIVGYRSIDTASLYGNEEGIARGIRESGVPRRDVFITTKVWNDQQGFDNTIAALEGSLSRLQTEYVDLYLVHWPRADLMAETWRAMERLLAQGKTRAIGVCNHLPHHLEALHKTATVPPVLDQVEFHPWLQQPSLQAYLVEHDIVLEAWAPLMKGRIAESSELVSVAEKHSVTPAQVAIRWILQLGYVTIPKSVHAERIAENADVFGFALDDEDMALIATADRGHRFGPDPDNYA